MLVLEANGNLVLYKHDPVTMVQGEAVWATGISVGRAVSLTVGLGWWRIFALVADITSDRNVYSDQFGTEYKHESGGDFAPFKMRVGDDGIIRITNREGRAAWVSSPVGATDPGPSTRTPGSPRNWDEPAADMPAAVWRPPPPPTYGSYGHGRYGYGTYPPPYGFSPSSPTAPVYTPPRTVSEPAGPLPAGKSCRACHNVLNVRQ